MSIDINLTYIHTYDLRPYFRLDGGIFLPKGPGFFWGGGSGKNNGGLKKRRRDVVFFYYSGGALELLIFGAKFQAEALSYQAIYICVHNHL